MRLLAGWALPALLATALAAPLVPSNDAGSGGDAGDTREEAWGLPGYGWYTGNLTPLADHDWYRGPRGAHDPLFCVEARLASPVAVNVTLAVDGVLGAGEVRATLAGLPAATGALGLALPATSGSYVGLAPGVRGGEALLTPYRFELAGLRYGDLGPGDAGTGLDAAATLAGAIPVPRPCVAGTVEGTAGDVLDLYGFAGEPGDVVHLTFLSLNVDSPLRLLDPGGLVAGWVSNASGGSFVLDEAGTWYVAVSTSTSHGLGRYVFAIADDPGNGCRPFCGT